MKCKRCIRRLNEWVENSREEERLKKQPLKQWIAFSHRSNFTFYFNAFTFSHQIRTLNISIFQRISVDIHIWDIFFVLFLLKTFLLIALWLVVGDSFCLIFCWHSDKLPQIFNCVYKALLCRRMKRKWKSNCLWNSFPFLLLCW